MRFAVKALAPVPVVKAFALQSLADQPTCSVVLNCR